jgi:uncharacterized protein YaaQ
MKMIVAIMDNTKSEEVSKALLAANFRVTRMASTGGFLRGGSTTLMIGVETARVEDALQLIRDQFTPATDSTDRQATLYVLNIKKFKSI